MVAHSIRLFVSLLFTVSLFVYMGCTGVTRVPAVEPEARIVPRVLTYEEQRRFDGLFLEAVCQKQKGNFDAEYELLSAALSVNPNAPEALFELAQLKLSFGRMADTLHRVEGDSLLRRAIALAPDNMTCKEVLANHLARQGKYGEAIRLYEEMTAASPSVSMLSVLVALQEESGDYEGAVETITRLEAMDGKSEQYSIEKFKLYNELGDNERAYAAVEELCAEYPNDLSYRVLLGDLYQQNGYHEMALAVYRDVLAVEPSNSYAQISLLAYYKTAGEDSLYQALVEEVVLNPHTQSEAKIEAMRGYVTGAVQAKKDSTEVLSLFRRVLAEPQENRGIGELCAYYMTGIGMPMSSLEPVMVRILEVEPDYSRARLQLLDILLRKGDMEAVAKLCRDGSLYDPMQVVFYYYEGLALIRLGRNRDAMKAFLGGVGRISEETDTQMASELYASLGDLYHEMGQTDSCYAAYDKSLSYKPDNMMCLNNYAYFLSLDGHRLEDAEDMSRRTVDAEPANAVYLDTYAWILYQREQYTQARIFIDQALEHLEETVDNASVFDHAGVIYYRCGEAAEAVTYWTKALNLTDDEQERAAVERKVRTRKP